MSSPNVLVVLDVGVTVTADDQRLPTAVVDASNHPAVADLARVHAIDGIGDVRTAARLLDVNGVAVLLLDVSMTSPVFASFALAFDRRAHGPFLDDVVAAEHLVIATTEPADAVQDQPLWLAVDIEGGALRAALDSTAG